MERIIIIVSENRVMVAQRIEDSQKEVKVVPKVKNNRLGKLLKIIFLSRKPKVVIKYRISSLFLKECFEYLMSSPEEVIHYVSGIELGKNHFLMDRLGKVQHRASMIGAKADIKDLTRKLIQLDEGYGHMLLGVFHSHPFGGVFGTCPSGIDRNLQGTLEGSGYKAIQAIFSRDGYIRFFSNKLLFEIEIYGKGVEIIRGQKNEKIIKLSKPGV